MTDVASTELTPVSARADGAAGSWLSALTADEIKALRAQSSVRSVASLAVNWGIIFGSLALVYLWPTALGVVLALVLIGGRQLGCAILMHEASHRTLFPNRKVNDWAGNWLCGYPMFVSLDFYRAYHMQHHAKTGTEKDPDLGLSSGFPVTRASMARKVARDLSGITGLKRLVQTFGFVLGALFRKQARATTGTGTFAGGELDRKTVARALLGFVVSNFVLFALCALLLHPVLYLVWLGAYLTTYSLSMRIRSIAEHALVPDPSTPLGQTRTVLAGPVERLLVAPNRVNYHLEHHLLMTVPHYRLPEMHALLRARGVLDEACIAKSYVSVLRQTVQGAP